MDVYTFQTLLQHFGATEVLEKYSSLKSMDLRVVKVVVDGEERLFWVADNKYVVSSISELKTFPELKRAVRDINLKFHPDKCKGEIPTELLSLINHNPSPESISALLNILTMSVRKNFVEEDKVSVFFRVCSTVELMFGIFSRKCVGGDFFNTSCIQNMVVTFVESSYMKLLQTPLRELVVEIFEEFTPVKVSTLVKHYKVNQDVQVIVMFIKLLHKLIGKDEDWVDQVQTVLRSLIKTEEPTVEPVEEPTVEPVEDIPKKRKRVERFKIRKSPRLAHIPTRRSPRLACK